MINPGFNTQMIDEENGKPGGEDPGDAKGSPPRGEVPDAHGEGHGPEETDPVAKLEQSLAQAKDQVLRKAAEFENYKKRMESETGVVIRFANEDMLLRLLPVLDDFERSFKALGKTPPGSAGSQEPSGIEAGQNQGAFLTGIEIIYGKFKKILEQSGLVAFDSSGQPFNPELHDALLQVPREDVPHHTVVEEIERGYRLNEKVLRHARVVVSSKSDSAPE